MVKKGKFGSYESAQITDGALCVTVSTLGASVLSLTFEGRERVLGFKTPDAYLHSDCYVGGVVGRYANRIAGAVGRIDGEKVFLIPNENGNHLHGGHFAFDKRTWEMEVRTEHSVRFRLLSQHLDNGYPGDLTAQITYTVSGSELRIDFEGWSNRDTFYGPTAHLYFTPEGTGSALEMSARIDADAYVATDGEGIPTGICPCEDAFDFRTLRKIGTDVDHCFVLNGAHAVTLCTDKTRMEVYTDYPGLQMYTGAFLNGFLHPHDGVAIEPSFFPDAPNHPEYPSAVLRAGESFHKYARYVFSGTEA